MSINRHNQKFEANKREAKTARDLERIEPPARLAPDIPPQRQIWRPRMLATGSEKLERTRDGRVVYIGAARLGPALRERGLIFVGIDVIDGFLTEINVTSPTGIRAIKNLGGPDIAALIWDAIEAKRR
jgi:hypothetical protein